MIIKVQCPCGTRFQFEVMPVNGRMPTPVHCPTCNADDTELANALIQQQLSAATSAPVPAPASGLRVAGLHKAQPQPAAPVAPPASATPASETSAGEVAPLCPKHKTEAAIDVCKVCGKPICLKCMEQFGYVCGVYCRQQATAKRIYIPPCPHQKSVIAGKAHAKVKWIATGVTTVAVLMLGLWIWYTFMGREPKLVYSLPIPMMDPGSHHTLRPEEYYQLIAPGELLTVKNKHASLFDFNRQQQVWSTPLQTDAEAEAAKSVKTTTGDSADAFRPESDYDLSNPSEVVLTTNDIWLAFRNEVLRLDRQTGQRKETLVRGNVLNFSSTEDALLAVCISPNGQRTLTRISLPDGTVQTANLAEPSGELKPTTRILAQKGLVNTNFPKLHQMPEMTNDPGIRRFTASSAEIMRGVKNSLQPNNGNIAPSRVPANALDEMGSYVVNDEEVPPFILAGQNVIQFQATLLERKTVSHQAMKSKPNKSVLDSNVTASQGLDLAQEMMNDSRREATGGVEIEDVSRFQVTLHRWFADNVPDWTGEVTGPPSVYALKTVDLLVAGQTVMVFDKRNKKLWEAKMAFPIRTVANHPPFLEKGDALYFADAGVLACFELASGNVRWRLNSVGISSIQADERQNIYVTSTTAGPDQIMHPQEINLREKIHPLILKVNPKNGKVLWRLESVGDDCRLSGKFLYATKERRVMAALRLEEGPDRHYNLALLDRSSGSTIWNYHKVNRMVLKTEVQKNWILLQMADEVVVLKFFSL